MGDMAEVFNFMKKAAKEKRELNRLQSPAVLKRYGVAYSERNGGAHLICQYGPRMADFWPGTGRWQLRNGKSGRGVFKLCAALGAKK